MFPTAHRQYSPPCGHERDFISKAQLFVPAHAEGEGAATTVELCWHDSWRPDRGEAFRNGVQHQTVKMHKAKKHSLPCVPLSLLQRKQLICMCSVSLFPQLSPFSSLTSLALASLAGLQATAL